MSMRVLIVEDSPQMAMFLREILTFMGEQVASIATTEDEAVAAAAQHSPDLLLLDVRLRQGDGLVALSRILRHGHVPHVVMSGSAVDPKLLGHGSAILRKPFSDVELQNAIQQALGRRCWGADDMAASHLGD